MGSLPTCSGWFAAGAPSYEGTAVAISGQLQRIGWDSIRVLFGSLLPNVHRHSFALAVLTHAVHAWQLCSKSRGLLPRFAAQPGMGGGASQRAVSHLFEVGIVFNGLFFEPSMA